MNNDYLADRDAIIIAHQDVDTRATFITRTYGHLAGAIIAFTLLEVIFFTTGVADSVMAMLAGSQWAWLVALGAFMVVGVLASNLAHRSRSLGTQYMALGGFVLAEALIFIPLLWIADKVAPGAIASAALVTLLGFGALTCIAFWLRKDFSFLRGILSFAAIMALVAIVASFIFGFQLGVWFSVGMVALAGGFILYDTSNIMHHYDEDRYVAAALSLFASVAMMFWYVLQIFISIAGED